MEQKKETKQDIGKTVDGIILAGAVILALGVGSFMGYHIGYKNHETQNQDGYTRGFKEGYYAGKEDGYRKGGVDGFNKGIRAVNEILESNKPKLKYY